MPFDHFKRLILSVRGQRVLLDRDLAALYGVAVKALNQAVRRNRDRFPRDFMFALSVEETRVLESRASFDVPPTAETADDSRSQSVTLNVKTVEIHSLSGGSRRRFKQGANFKYLPLAFTEQGVAMLSTVLRSPRAVQVNIEIMRGFVQLRQMLQGHSKLATKLAELEKKYDGQFRVVFDAINELMTPDAPATPPIGCSVP